LYIVIQEGAGGAGGGAWRGHTGPRPEQSYPAPWEVTVMVESSGVTTPGVAGRDEKVQAGPTLLNTGGAGDQTRPVRAGQLDPRRQAVTHLVPAQLSLCGSTRNLGWAVTAVRVQQSDKTRSGGRGECSVFTRQLVQRWWLLWGRQSGSAWNDGMEISVQSCSNLRPP